jgi:Lon protease-like protein
MSVPDDSTDQPDGADRLDDPDRPEAGTAVGREMPMFPLGTVLVPGGPLPLHVFEPRYQAMVQHCLSGDREFGVVMITRGSEVGGGDLRTDVGTVARIAEAARLVNGRWALRCVGVRRVRVLRWLEDDPYPRAEVVDWPDELDADGDADELAALAARVGATLRQVLAQVAELGLRATPATIELPDDPTLASYIATAAGPFGAFDAYSLLTEPGPERRLTSLVRMLDEERDVLAQQLALAAEVLDPGALDPPAPGPGAGTDRAGDGDGEHGGGERGDDEHGDDEHGDDDADEADGHDGGTDPTDPTDPGDDTPPDDDRT